MDLVGRFGLDHHDRDVITSLAAGHDMSNTAPSSCSNGREGNPLAVDQRDPHAADGTGERQPEIWVDADAALIASTSYRSLGSRLRIVTNDLDLVAQARERTSGAVAGR